MGYFIMCRFNLTEIPDESENCDEEFYNSPPFRFQRTAANVRERKRMIR